MAGQTAIQVFGQIPDDVLCTVLYCVSSAGQTVLSMFVLLFHSLYISQNVRGQTNRQESFNRILEAFAGNLRKNGTRICIF